MFKKYFPVILIIFIVIFVGLIGCTTKNSIVGRWRLVADSDFEVEQSTDYDIEFYKDGTVVFYDPTGSIAGEYSLPDKNHLNIFNVANSYGTFFKIDVNGDKMTWEIDNRIYTFERIKDKNNIVEKQNDSAISETFNETTAVENKEKKSSIIAIPTEVKETLNDEYPFCEQLEQEDYIDPGWKYLNVKLTFKLLPLTTESIEDYIFYEDIYDDIMENIEIVTEQGWTYKVDSFQLPFVYPGGITTKDFFSLAYFYNVLDGFNIAGSESHLFITNEDICPEYWLRFKVSEESSGYKVKILDLPTIDLSEETDHLSYPTDIPDSNFDNIFNMGETIDVGDNGTIRIMDFNYNDEDENYKLTYEYENLSNGYDANFSTYFLILDNYGILRAANHTMEPIVHGLEYSINDLRLDSVGPGQTEECYVEFEMPRNLEKLKLFIGSETFDAIVNIN